MPHATSSQIERKIVRCRLIFSVAVAVAIVLDPLQPQLNPWLHLIDRSHPMDPDLLGTIFLHTAYSGCAYLAFRSGRIALERFASATTVADVLFAAVVFVTEGRSILFTPFFTFAIVGSGVRWGMRRTMIVTGASLTLWFAMIVVWAPEGAFFYVMRPVYLLIVGYLVGYLGEARVQLQSEVQMLAAADDRLRIARELHDGCAQVLSAVNLQLESCRNLARAGRTDALIGDLEEMQRSINAEHDELRSYLRALAGMNAPGGVTKISDPRIRVSIDIDASGASVDQVLRIVRESVTNVRRHAAASTAVIHAEGDADGIAISIDDDGRGFESVDQAPWSIASRVKELGGTLRLDTSELTGAHITIALPSS